MTNSASDRPGEVGSVMTRRRVLRITAGGVGGLVTVAVLDACGGSTTGTGSAPSAAAPTIAPTAAARTIAPTATPRPIEKVVYMNDFSLNGTAAPVFLARERGYYRDEGIDLEIQAGTGSANTATVVGAGTANVGRVDGGVVIASLAKKVPIKVVSGLEGSSPQAVVMKVSAPMRTPKDLEGKKLAGTPGGSSEALFPAWMKKNGADASKVEIVSSTAVTRRTFLLQGQVDGIFALTYSELHVLKAAGLDARAMLYADFGVNVPGKVFVANTQFLAQKPHLVKGFVAATLKGTADAKKDPKAAVDALVKDPAAQTLNAALEQQSLELQLPYFSSKRTQGKPLGFMDGADWSEAIDLLFEIGQITVKPSLADLFTNEFVPTS